MPAPRKPPVHHRQVRADRSIWTPVLVQLEEYSQLIGLDSGFTITQEFVFDARSDTTTVEVIDARYASGNPDVDLDFVLYGSAVSAVSEPVSLGLMLGGLAALGCIGRRRRAA